jgi:CelD/BcsL family acetyltransferase involved in cellulose biosynthesis
MAMLEAAEIHDLETIRPEWAQLWARSRATPFQHPAWLIPWARHIAEGPPLVIALRDGGELVGVLPFYVWHDPDAGTRKLFPLGIATSDYLDAAVLHGHGATALAAIAQHRLRFDLADWPQLRPGSPLLSAAIPPGWRERTDPAEPCPVLDLPADFEALRERVPAKTLRDLRTARRPAAERGGNFETATPATLAELREALFSLHAMRWAGQDEPGVLARPEIRAMHRAAMPELLQAGLLRLLALRVEGRIVAVLHALADPPDRARRTLYLYLQGFDPAEERLSPGLLLVGHAVQTAIAEGFGRVDFLRGQERYKFFWGATNAPTWRRVLIPPEG